MNLTDKNNMICKNCDNFKYYTNKHSKISDPIGYCTKKDTQPNSSYTCKDFVYAKEIICVSPEIDDGGKYICHRCGRPLTSEDSIAKGFGDTCYKKYLKELNKLSRRLF